MGMLVDDGVRECPLDQRAMVPVAVGWGWPVGIEGPYARAVLRAPVLD